MVFIDIIFDLDNEIFTNWKNKIRVSGMMTKHRKVVSNKNPETIGIRFKTGHFNFISNIPLSEIKNKTLNTSEIFPKLNNATLEELSDKKSHFEKLQFVSVFLITQIRID